MDVSRVGSCCCIWEGTETLGLMVLSLEDEYLLLLHVHLIFAGCCSQGKMQTGIEGRNVAEGSLLPKSSVDLGSVRNDELQGQV